MARQPKKAAHSAPAPAAPRLPLDEQVDRLRRRVMEQDRAVAERFVAAEVNSNSNYRRLADLERRMNAAPAAGSPEALLAAITTSIVSPAPCSSSIRAEFSHDGAVTRIEVTRYPPAREPA